MLKIALVGCGKIADQHVEAIQRIGNCRIVALCDSELIMAKQLGERFDIAECFSDVAEMLRVSTPDVVHILTPPQSHYALGKRCLEANANVYIEKPFAITAAETESLLALAESRRLKITAGHNLQFTLEMLEMRRLVQGGFLGGKPVHLESYFSYSLDDTSFVKPLLGNPNHWVRRLPGQLFHNVASHGIAKLAEFLDDDVEVTATAHQSDALKSMGGQEVLDELRVLIRDRQGTTALFCFSTSIRPPLNLLKLCGPVNSLIVNHMTGSVVRLCNRSYKSYLTYFVPPLVEAMEHLRNAFGNISGFMRRRLYQDFGMKELIERFYDSINKAVPPPIPSREILLTARIMDQIVAQVYPNRVAQPVLHQGAA